ncbi:hypothetical protein A1359_05885 [Methylomonas lenta]|uniref:PPM-type phosphatase domain-containing protein n=1 Tax=Methylomonas lenta TaxID=980561 RepID=A0A177NIE4_9GAMM|nr:PP2C family serine/threonine-protein phosphatase [Methylomonas lenta]OAI17622.1 hypothetical protein A1359_05885 [Methylomonas lenta]
MLVLPGNASHIGQRSQQQDMFALSDFADNDFIAHGGYLAVVADGIGGLLYGAEAAYIATSQFVESYLAKPSEIKVSEALDNALATANQAVYAAAKENYCPEQMGTTLVAVVIHQNQLHWRTVGDSHLYLCRDGRLSQLNVDHNFARRLQVQVGDGLITQEQADNHPERYALECFVGLNPLPEIARNQYPLPLLAGDKLLLCSDGVDGVLSADEIVDCLHATPMLAAEGLCDAVLKKNKLGQDNLTAVVLGYQVEDLTPIVESARMLQGSGWQAKASGTGLLLLITYLLVTKYLA